MIVVNRFFLLTGDGIYGRLYLCSTVKNTVVQKKEMKNVSVTYSMKTQCLTIIRFGTVRAPKVGYLRY